MGCLVGFKGPAGRLVDGKTGGAQAPLLFQARIAQASFEGNGIGFVHISRPGAPGDEFIRSDPEQGDSLAPL